MGERRRSGWVAAVFFGDSFQCCSGRRLACKLQQPANTAASTEETASGGGSFQPCFFRQESKTAITPNPAANAAAVKPAVEISPRE